MSKTGTSAAEGGSPYAARSDAAGAQRLFAHLAILGATTLVLSNSLDSWLALPAMTAHGIVLISLFAPLHETLHRTAFRTRWMNDEVAAVIGFVHFLPAGHFRRFHFAHHKFVRDPKRDPELQGPEPTDRLGYLFALSTLPYWGSRLRELARHIAGSVDAPYVPERAHARVIREARGHATGWAVIAALSIGFDWVWPLYFWILPTLIGQIFLRFYLIAEHGCCETGCDVWRNTRTVRSNAFVRFLMWNMPYHIEHHAASAVPFHALPTMHNDMQACPSVTAHGYGAFHRTMWRRLGLTGKPKHATPC